MPPSTGAPLRTTRGAKPLFDFHYFLWKEKFILGADSRSTLFIPPDIDIPSPLLLLPTPPTDPTNFPIRWSRCKREFKMTTIRSFSFPGMEAEWNWFAAYRSRGSKMSLSLSRIHPFVKMNEFSLPNVYRTLYNKQRNFLCIRRTRDHKNLWIFFFLFFFRSHVDLFKGSDLYEALQYL